MASPKASKDDQLQALFTKLAPQIRSQQHKKAVRTLDSILKLQPADQDAIKCKIAVLLEGSTFQEAMDYISKLDEGSSFAFEEAYALYRLNRLPEALQKLKQQADTPAKLLLEAQLQHRMNNFAGAIEIYNQLVQERKVKAAEVGTNIVAAYVSAGRSHEVPAVMAALSLSGSDGFELAFNQACAELAAGKPQKAEQQLLLAHRLGKESLYEEDLPEEEVDAELAPLTTQLAYVASQLGRSAEASTSYQDLINKGKADENVLAVAQNNLVALQSASHAQQKRFAGEAMKKLEALIDTAKPGYLLPNLEARLSEQQRQTLLMNHALLLLLGNKADACQEQLQHLKTRYSGSASVALLEASIQAKSGNAAAASETLAAVQPSHDDSGLEAVLMRAQLAASAGNISQAASILGSIQEPELQHKPAVLATCIALLEQSKDVAGAIRKVQEALDWWQNSMTADKTSQAAAESWLQQQMVHMQLKAGDKSKAAAAFQQLQALDRTSSASAMMLGQLARASANANPQAAVALQKQLPPMPKLSSNIDLDDLEQKGARKNAGSAKKRPSEADLTGGAADRQKKKRKRKPKLPKGFDPENPGPPPDPERWLPKWQRSDFKKKRNRRREQTAVKGSQGAGRVDESLDSSIAGNEPVAEPSKPKGPARPAGAKGKKKGKR